MTIRSCLENCAKAAPCSAALEYHAGKEWRTRSWKEFLDGVRALAESIGGGFGLKPREENAAVMLGNSPEWMESYLALSGAGVAVVPLDPKLHDAEVKYILQDSSAVVAVTDKAHLDMMRRMAPELPALRGLVVADAAPGEEFAPEGSLRICGYSDLKEAGAAGAATPQAWYGANVAAPEDVASVIYTSGTTGKPKGAMLTHANFIADIDGALGAFGERIDSRDSLLVVLPLFHAFSFCTNFVLGLFKGCTMKFVRSLYTIGEDVKTLRPTVVMSVPLLAEKMHSKIAAKVDGSFAAKALLALGLKCIVRRSVLKGLGGKLRFMIVGGAPCPAHVLEGYRRIGISVLEGYGLTECSPVVSIAGPKCARIGTIGVKLSNIEVRLAEKDESGVGELQVKGPVTMKGYFRNDEATREAFDGEWLRTGDLASIDADGLITIRGRKKALIVNREGKNVYPEEVENRIAGDPVVADCVVVGYTTGGLPGEKVGCVVHPNAELLKELNGGKELSPEEIEKEAARRVHARCADMADYKRVRKVKVSAEPLERTSIQKVRRVAYKGALDE